ncbi:GNAT family N-acetyltransferase [Streptomyces sp. TRM43335]|uniref:GNAT family N-acetyltransferase n=1 Tax=Streptomyces taklimakanensis TaxID=2569853 RepID=A0A6G2BHF2_9ACTN|nr:GNAT family N-acetyltransferase [Streptomyces taklimakanensis]MTE21705.1 GNAT family N-acetyltransferase [Streptomyces taklimakanensis]
MPTAATNRPVSIIDAPAHSRFEARVGTTLTGFVDYVRTDDLVSYPRVVVSRPFRGQGIGDRLLRTAVEDARRRGLRIRPACAFVEQWLELNPEYRELVSGGPGDEEEETEGGHGRGPAGGRR